MLSLLVGGLVVGLLFLSFFPTLLPLHFWCALCVTGSSRFGSWLLCNLVALQFGVRERSSCVRRCVRYMGFNATISDHRYCTSDDQTFETGDGGAHAGPCARAGVHESRVELSRSMYDAVPRGRGTRRLDIPGCSNCGPPGPRDPG